MKISKVEIKKFRNLENISFSVGKKLTAIAGQNCTSKTALLGIISHIFNFDVKYRTLNNYSFYAKYSEIFRFSYPDYDKAGQHIYKITFENGDTVNVASYDRTKNKKPINLRLRVGKSAKGRGKIKMPVIYLGMKRLFPFAQEPKITKDIKTQLSVEDVDFYKKVHNEVLLMDEQVETDHIITKNKDFFTPRTQKYDYLGISAGQDNIGQIITAVLSFKRLKEQLKDKYPGGFIFIDEMDASLYPGAQLKLIEFFYKIAGKLNLQVFFTTHSLEILEAVSRRTQNRDGVIVYLDNHRGKITPKLNPDINKIRNDLKVFGPEQVGRQRAVKVDFYLEDDVAKQFANNILNEGLKKKLNLISARIGEGTLQTVAKNNLPAFKNSFFILDGDVSIRKSCSKVLKLPGKEPPELIAFEFLHSLPKDDEFWGDSESGYTRQFCFRDCQDSSNHNKVKEWYKNQKPFWGKNASKMWHRWKTDNKTSINEFNNLLKEKLKK
ncbi:MAG: hypothetical protein AUJ81_10445 [Helicobacteraceae bacterium CG1_02_36_14]|nr:MAG: hypothetical protein AUJ81_10445 [Helicobacteraceae bacterium CG1_02_36_14]